MRIWRYTAAFLTGAFMAAILAVGVVALNSPDDDGMTVATVSDVSNTPTEPATDDAAEDTGAVANTEDECLSAADIYEMVNPSVVEIQASSTAGGTFQQQNTSAGTGVVIDELGHILTNNHVVADADSISVIFANGDVVDAVRLGTDPANDLAVIQVDVDEHEVMPADLGDSDELRVGDPVLALGNPFNLPGTLTQGIVSALDRTYNTGTSTRPIRDMIQTDAPINPGNSGGPLINCHAEIIGINTLLENPTGDRVNVGIGFAVSINTAKSELDQLIAGVPIPHAWLGIKGMNLTPAAADGLGLTVNEGAYVLLVAPNSPADDAGLIGAFASEAEAQSATDPVPGGDVIVALEDEPVTNIDELATRLDQDHNPGDTVEMTVVRGSDEITIEATLADWPG